MCSLLNHALGVNIMRGHVLEYSCLGCSQTKKTEASEAGLVHQYSSELLRNDTEQASLGLTHWGPLADLPQP